MRYFFLVFFIFFIVHGNSQCEVKSKLWPDQTMYFSVSPELFFYTEVKSLKGNITTDKHNYFLRLLPKPFPAKEEKKNLDHAIKIVLTNDSAIVLENFDVEYRSRDTSLSLMYLIPDKFLSLFTEHDVKSLTIDLGDQSGERHYGFVLHKATLREQLNCLKKIK